MMTSRAAAGVVEGRLAGRFRCAGAGAGTGGAGAREAAGGQQGEEVGEAAAGAGEAVVQPGDERAVVLDAAEEEQGDGRKYPVKPLGQLDGWLRGGDALCS